MSDEDRQDDQPRDGRTRVPERPVWGIPEAVAIGIAWLCLQILAGRLLHAEESLARQMAAVLVSGVLVLVLVTTFLRAKVAGRVPVRRLLGIVLPDSAAVIRAVPALVIGIVVYIGVNVGWAALLQRQGVMEKQIPLQPLVGLIEHSRSTWGLTLAVLAASVMAPIVEETIFRGVLYLPTRRALGRLPAAALVSLLFALAHGYVWGAPQLFVLSCIFVALFERTGTLLAPMLAHSAYNTFHLIILLLAMSSGAVGT